MKDSLRIISIKRSNTVKIVPFYFWKCTDLRSYNWPLSEQKSFSFKLTYNLCFQRLKKLKNFFNYHHLKKSHYWNPRIKVEFCSQESWSSRPKIALFKTTNAGLEFSTNICCVKSYLERLNFMVIKLRKIYYWWKYTCSLNQMVQVSKSKSKNRKNHFWSKEKS